MQPLGYGVIGNTGDSGSSILGSSPGTPTSKGYAAPLKAAFFMSPKSWLAILLGKRFEDEGGIPQKITVPPGL